MLRTLAAFAALLVLCASGVGMWRALQPPIEALIPSGAVGIRVVATGWGERQIVYQAPGPAFAWYYSTADRLAAHGWAALDRWRPAGTGSVYNPMTPLRFQQLYVVVQDQVVLMPDQRFPNRARIQVRRRIALRWHISSGFLGEDPR